VKCYGCTPVLGTGSGVSITPTQTIKIQGMGLLVILSRFERELRRFDSYSLFWFSIRIIMLEWMI
jgi:hypothetical protein